MKNHSKAIGGGVGGAVAVLLGYLANMMGLELSAEVLGALTILISAAGAWLAPANS